MVCLALLGVLLFSSCASSPQGTAQTASADSSAEEQTAPGEDETLRDQLISTLNLCQPQNRVVASDSLDESASFLAGIILENAALYAVSDGSRVLKICWAILPMPISTTVLFPLRRSADWLLKPAGLNPDLSGRQNKRGRRVFRSRLASQGEKERLFERYPERKCPENRQSERCAC